MARINGQCQAMDRMQFQPLTLPDGKPWIVNFQDWKPQVYAQYNPLFGDVALRLIEESDTIARATVTVRGLPSDQLAIKNFDENTGMLEALKQDGMIESLGQTMEIERTNVDVVTMSPHLQQQLDEFKARIENADRDAGKNR